MHSARDGGARKLAQHRNHSTAETEYRQTDTYRKHAHGRHIPNDHRHPEQKNHTPRKQTGRMHSANRSTHDSRIGYTTEGEYLPQQHAKRPHITLRGKVLKFATIQPALEDGYKGNSRPLTLCRKASGAVHLMGNFPDELSHAGIWAFLASPKSLTFATYSSSRRTLRAAKSLCTI